MGISAEDKRKNRKQMIYDLVKNIGTIEIKKLLGVVSTNTGLTYETIKQMIKELTDAELIKIENNKVTLVERENVVWLY